MSYQSWPRSRLAGSTTVSATSRVSLTNPQHIQPLDTTKARVSDPRTRTFARIVVDGNTRVVADVGSPGTRMG